MISTLVWRAGMSCPFDDAFREGGRLFGIQQSRDPPPHLGLSSAIIQGQLCIANKANV
jgi:hypothetical protein